MNDQKIFTLRFGDNRFSTITKSTPERNYDTFFIIPTNFIIFELLKAIKRKLKKRVQVWKRRYLFLKQSPRQESSNDEKGICRKHPKIKHYPMAQHSQPLETFQKLRKASVSERLKKQSKNIPRDRKFCLKN